MSFGTVRVSIVPDQPNPPPLVTKPQVVIPGGRLPDPGMVELVDRRLRLGQPRTPVLCPALRYVQTGPTAPDVRRV